MKIKTSYKNVLVVNSVQSNLHYQPVEIGSKLGKDLPPEQT